MKNIFQQCVLILRKLGILRYGVKSYNYTDGKSMSAGALLDDVYDEKKDLVTKEDLQKPKNSSVQRKSSDQHSLLHQPATGVIINCIDKSSKNSYGKKQPDS